MFSSPASQQGNHEPSDTILTEKIALGQIYRLLMSLPHCESLKIAAGCAMENRVNHDLFFSLVDVIHFQQFVKKFIRKRRSTLLYITIYNYVYITNPLKT